MERIINYIQQLNSGSLIPNVDDSNAKHILETQSTILYRDNGNDGNYYFFSTYDLFPQEGSIRGLKEIEIESLSVANYSYIDKPVPSRSYLLLFCEVSDETDLTDVYREVIRLEENEFLFKKYVVYYTATELNAFDKWYAEQRGRGNNNADQLLQLDEIRENIG